MFCWRTSSCILFLLLSIIVCSCYGEAPIVSTTYGDVLGERIYFSENQYLNYSGNFSHFKGIPYAKPPVGDLRFRPPEAVEPWSDVYNATYYRSYCPQSAGGSEDCLYINVLVPDNNLTDVAVLVYFYGGQYIAGSGAEAYYWGVPLLAASGGDVIYVTFNYRLGVLGFLSTGDDIAPGNYGLLDQSMAIQWVYNNIKAFGGDPYKITIGGISAGSGSVSAQLLAHSEDNLFQRAIMQSGSMFERSAMIELNISRAVDANRQVASILGCETTSSSYMITCMRNASVNDILAATGEVTQRYNLPRRSPVFYPVVDGKFIPDHPQNLIKRGEFSKVDVILGTNLDEGTYWLNRIYDSNQLLNDEPPFMNRTYFQDNLQKVYQNENILFVESIMQEYTDWEFADDLEYNHIYPWVLISTDDIFQCPTDATARTYADAGRAVYRYVNTHIPSRRTLSDAYRPEWIGTSHIDELPYVFGWYFNSEFETKFNQTEEEIMMSIKVMRYWTNFVKTGDPNMADTADTIVAEKWPLFTIPGLEYKKLSPEMENSRAVNARECSFWANYIPKVSLYTDDLSELEIDWRNSYYDWKYFALNDWQKAFDEYKNQKKECPNP
ncbi:cholinesterase-like [Antedon mediterranea]|uniref:cholinesterase-like n=1 Tax=Antedon mediterranea TaxID=105859 RepID=UPI003AF6788A